MNETVTNDRAMTSSVADAANNQVPAPTGTQQPNGNGAYAPPQPARSMWPVYLMFAGAVVYLILPIDLIPDFLVGPGQCDDLFMFYMAYKKWRERKQQGGAGSGPQSQRPMDEPVMLAELADQPHWERPSRRLYGMVPEPEEPGFFSRLFKAVMYVVTGGAL